MKLHINIHKERCKGCGICVEVCQTGVLVLSEKKNERDCNIPEVVAMDECINCRMCEMFCPDFAIWVTEEEEEAA
ncbi:MAG: 4Fe-4S binding protein [Candidatus Aminicenantes bacterium]|nr:4Fe-4S binding protein [Candidatus Aminicenantes bacterium]